MLAVDLGTGHTAHDAMTRTLPWLWAPSKIRRTLILQIVLASHMYWACPFIPFIWKQLGPVRGCCLRVGFEASYAINT